MNALPTAALKPGAALAVLAAASVLSAAGCATPSTSLRAAPLASAASQPLKDLNLLRSDPLPLLERAASDPYAPPPRDCAAIEGEVQAFDAALGPDFDPSVSRERGPGLVQDLAEVGVREVVGLPYRGAVRRVTGAETRDRQARRLVLAGSLRRAYLKGVAHAIGCDAPRRP